MFRILAHGAELEDFELFSFVAKAFLTENGRPFAVELDEQSDKQHGNSENQKSCYSEQDIQNTFYQCIMHNKPLTAALMAHGQWPMEKC